MPNIPGVNFEYPTGGLALGTQEDVRNESILIIDTAEDGPTDTVVRMRSPAYLRSIYGNKATGNLVRRAEEAWYAQTGRQDIRCLRISDGRKARLEVAEGAGTGLAHEQPTGTSITGQTVLTHPALVLEAKWPSAVYNQTTIRMGYSPTGLLSVILYNPKSGLESYYSYNPDPNAYADVHNVRELADAINADTNAAAVLTATANPLEAHAELVVDPAGDVALPNDGSVYYDVGYAWSLWGSPGGSALAVPTLPTAVAALGGSLAANTYDYKYSALTNVGTTVASSPLAAAIVLTGEVETLAVATGGTGYSVGDVLTVTGGNADCTYTVATISGGGSTGPVATVTETTPGTGYVTATGAATTVAPAGGTGCTVNITVKNTITVTLTRSTSSDHFVIGYKIYRQLAGAGLWYYIATVDQPTSGATFTWSDTGALTPSATITAPAADTTVDAYPATAPDGSNYALTGVTMTADGRMRLNLSERLLLLANESNTPTLAPLSTLINNGSYGAGVFKHWDRTAAYISQTSGNRLAELTKIGEIAGTAYQVLNCPGYAKADLPYAPIVPPPLRYDNSGTDTLVTFSYKLRPLSQAWTGVEDEDPTFDYAAVLGRSGSSTDTLTKFSTKDWADALQVVVRGFVGVIPMLPDDATTVELDFASHLPPDTGQGGGIITPAWYTDYLTAVYGAATYWYGPNTVEVYEVTSGGAFTLAEDIGHAYTISWTDSVGGAEPTAKITFTGADPAHLPQAGTSIYVSYKSLPGKLTQASSLIGVMNKTGWDAWKTYFVTGRRITFGGPLPTPLQLGYAYERDWSVGGDVTILDYTDGIIEWTDRANQPGTSLTTIPPTVVIPAVSGGIPAPDYSSATAPAVATPDWSRLVLYYEYDPEWLDLGTSARALMGGTSGVNMTVSTMYTAMANAYNMISNYRVDHLILPYYCYIDSTKQEPNPVTGVFEPVNAGFQTQLTAALDVMLANVHETMAYISIAPPADNKLITINDWVRKATVVDPSDTVRAANWMSILTNRLVHVFAMQPIVSNPAALQYVSDGIPSFVGAYAELPLNEGMTMHQVPSWVGLRFELSVGQLEDMTASRYITSRVDPHTNLLVVTDVPSAAAAGDDYARSTTTRIVRRICDDVRTAVSPFLGKLSEDAVYNAAATAISNVLKSHLTQGSLRNGSTFKLFASAADRIRGIMNVRLALAVNFEIRIINVVVNLIPA